jgi:hypothetical protein
MDTSKLDDFTSGFLECALWSSTDDDGEPLDASHSIDDIQEASLAYLVKDCQDFRSYVAALSHGPKWHFDLLSVIDNNPCKAGADFWLTRNRHGAGFWDGDWPEPAGRILTEAAHTYGGVELYVGDDGLIRVQGVLDDHAHWYTDEPAGPDEGDYVTSDYILWYEHGTNRLLLRTQCPPEHDFDAPADDWKEQVRAHMDAEQFRPDAWLVSDHGNAHRIDLGEGS